MAALSAAEDSLRAARKAHGVASRHFKAGHAASASVLLTMELLRLRTALLRLQDEEEQAAGHVVDDEPDQPADQQGDDAEQLERLRRGLQAAFAESSALERECAQRAARRMLVYGVLLKEGHRRSSKKLRLFVLDGGRVSYYKLGSTRALGSFPVARVTAVTRDQRRHGWSRAEQLLQRMTKVGCKDGHQGYKAPHPAPDDHTLHVEMAPPVRTAARGGWHASYTLTAPDAASRQVWEEALLPRLEGQLELCSSGWPTEAEAWTRVRAVLHKPQIALFADGDSDPVEMQLTDVLGLSVQRLRLPEPVAGRESSFDVISLLSDSATIYLREVPGGHGPGLSDWTGVIRAMLANRDAAGGLFDDPSDRAVWTDARAASEAQRPVQEEEAGQGEEAQRRRLASAQLDIDALRAELGLPPDPARDHRLTLTGSAPSPRAPGAGLYRTYSL